MNGRPLPTVTLQMRDGSIVWGEYLGGDDLYLYVGREGGVLRVSRGDIRHQSGGDK